MLSFSYDYDILSWGLLHHFQVRMMRVWLLDQPSGCLSNLSLPCQDRVIARALLMDVTNDYFLKEKSQKRGTVQKPFVVCNIVLDEHDSEWSKLFDGNLVYRCCSNGTKRVVNETLVECGLHVKVSVWLHFFYHVINYATLPMLLFWTAIIDVLPDFLFTFEDKEDAEKAPEKTDKKDSSQTRQKSRKSPTNNAKGICCCKESQEDSPMPLSENIILRRGSTSSYGSIEETTFSEENDSCAKKLFEKIICCEMIETPPPPDGFIGDKGSQKTHDSKGGSNNVTLGETSTHSTSDQNDANKSQKNHDSEQESHEVIPVDDVSPITITRLMRYCTGKSSVICSDYSKLLFLYYILLFIIYYYKLLFSVLYKDKDLRRAINIPGARFEGQLSEWFDITKVYFDLSVPIMITFVVVLIVLPLIPIFHIKPCHLQDSCSECGKNPFYLRTDIREQLRSAPRQMFSLAKYFATGGCFMRCFKNRFKTCSRSALASRPSVHCFRTLVLCSRCRCKDRYSCCGIFCKICVIGLLYSIMLFVSFILFWGVVLAALILPYLILFAVAAGLILFWCSPFCRFFFCLRGMLFDN